MENRINNPFGFTMFELIFTLSLLSLLLLLILPLKTKAIQRLEEKIFMETLMNDVLYLQNTQLPTSNPFYYIYFYDEYYDIGMSIFERKARRYYPSHIKLYKNNIGDIIFKRNGTIFKSGRVTFSTEDRFIEFICPLGKGRCYFNEVWLHSS